MLVLGIESTCDETACSVVRDGKEILSNVIASQTDLHAKWGGVVPELACRRHIDILIPTIDEAIHQAGITLDRIDLIAVAHGPGLAGALLIGLNAAKSLALSLKKPFIGVNHIEAHLYAALMNPDHSPLFPCLGAVLSGGHTTLVKMEGIGSYQTVSRTTDDAIGEAFDKVAKILGLPYPGGPRIEALAKEGDPEKYPFKPGTVKKDPAAFSFSGLKTAVLYAVKGQNGKIQDSSPVDLSTMRDIAASFQKTAFEDVIKKTLLAADKHGCNGIIFGGGVTNNQALRALFREACTRLPLYWPEPVLSLDNGAMIAGLGYHKYSARKTSDGYDLEANCSLEI